MSELPVLKRKYHSFLSHAHADKDFVQRLDRWLHDISGIPIWYGNRDLQPGSQIAAELPDAIAQCRSIILILSKTCIVREWVQEEYQAAIGQRTSTKGRFRILGVRIEESEIPGLLQTTKWIDVLNRDLDLHVANGILDGLYHTDTSVDLEKVRDLYISRSWRGDESSLADSVCQIEREASDYSKLIQACVCWSYMNLFMMALVYKEAFIRNISAPKDLFIKRTSIEKFLVF
jgi:hypothetical protein